MGLADYLCECDDGECRETIPLELDEILFLRRHPGFVVIPGHQGPDDEIIGTDSDERYVYVAESNEKRAARFSDEHVEVH